MKFKVYFSILLVIILFGCSKDNEPQTGSIQISILIKDSLDPVFDALVSIPLISQEKLTGVEGSVFFENIEVGDYEVSIEVPFSNVILKEIITIELNKTADITILVNGPNVITPAILDIDKWIDSTYISLISDDIFGAKGYASIWGDIGSDIFIANNSNIIVNKLDKYEYSPSDKSIEDIWTNHYKVIRKANIGIEAIESSEFTSELNTDKNIAMAHFKFLRALVYFNLVKLFGNPVLVTSTDISEINNTQDALKIYELIEQDLIFAENNLGTSTLKSRASNSAAQALLGKAYIQMAGFPLLQNDKYSKALEQFAKLEGKFSLETDYKNNFLTETSITSNEIIFAIDFSFPEDPNISSWDWFYWGPKNVTERDFYSLTTNFIESYFKDPNDLTGTINFPLSPEDSRFFENIAPFTIQSSSTINAQDLSDWRPFKFSENYHNEEPFNLPYLRYSDILLMVAEAENAINGPTNKAYNAFNKIRRRAFGNTNNDLDSGINQEEFLNAVLNERRLELCYEGHRKDDLIRTQKLESVIESHNLNNPQNIKSYQPHKYVFPIPQLEVDLNPGVIQNNGY